MVSWAARFSTGHLSQTISLGPLNLTALHRDLVTDNYNDDFHLLVYVSHLMTSLSMLQQPCVLQT